jgi:6-phosphofructokinase
VLTTEMVDDIHKEGGTILGTSRGPWTWAWPRTTLSSAE